MLKIDHEKTASESNLIKKGKIVITIDSFINKIKLFDDLKFFV
jgi:hypothetical protein